MKNITIETLSGKKTIGRRVGTAGEYYYELPTPSAPHGGWWTRALSGQFISVPSNSRALLAALGELAHCSWCRTGYVTSINSPLCGKCREESEANRAYNASRTVQS